MDESDTSCWVPGFILRVFIHSAAIHDRDGARLVLPIPRQPFGWLRRIFVDRSYAAALVNWVKTLLPGRGPNLETVKRGDAHKHRFVVVPKR